MIKSYVDNALKNYPRVVSASVVSIKDKQAVVRMPYATDASSDFTAYVVTSQLVSVGDVVNVAYWSSLSTAVILANTSTASASVGVAGDYNTLENKPVVNGVTLSGEKTSADLKLYGDGNEPSYPVTSVNDKTGAVVLAADDVGALPDTTVIPTKTSDLTNDSGYITSDDVPVKSVAGRTGEVVLSKSDVGLGSVDNVRQYSASNPPPYPVTSVDGSTGAVTTNAVKTTTQTLTAAQQQQARTNIGAGTSSFDGNYNSLTNKPTIPSKTSQLENDSDFATETQVGAKYTKPASGIPKSDLAQSVQDSLGKADTALQEAPVTSVDGSVGAVVTNAVKTTTQTLTNAQKQQARENIGAGTSSFSGNYNDLTNKPSIPTKTSELTNDSDFATTTQVDAKYTKPANGIPKTDLTKDVQDSLTKADTALQSAPVTSVNDKTGDVVLSKDDVGLGNVDNVRQYSASNPPPYPVTSVDGATGAVVTNAVKTTTQTLTAAQQQQARTNIGAGTSSFSGSYNDLTNKPVIPTKTSELENDSNFATVAQVNAKYTKPTAGIPETDLSKDVQDSLAKADTALQSAPVTSVNSKTGAVNLTASDVGAVSTGDITQILGTSTTKVPSEKAVSDAMSSAGYGDMLKTTYDPTNVVADGGGIASYVATELKSYLKYTIKADGGVTLIFDD